MLTYWFFRIASVVVPHLPLRFGYWLATVIAGISFVVQTRARRNAENNLRHVLGPAASRSELEETTRMVFENSAKNYYDLFRVPGMDLDTIKRTVEVRGMENLLGALRAGKGAILVSPHMGNFDLAAQVAAPYSIKVTIPVERLKPQKLFDLITSTRAAKGVRLVPVGGGALKAIYQAIEANELVAIAADRDVMKNGIEVEFFGEKTTVPEAPALIASRTGAAIIPAYSVRHPDGTCTIYVEPVLQLRSSDNPRDDVRVNTQMITGVMERFIRENPEQWVVLEPVWGN
ncbi:MAG: hypothetical protein M0T85_15450 [Dehalococcoidales bacterium]|nr:hypothetical protein [Dehalococcoidales bacterium]